MDLYCRQKKMSNSNRSYSHTSSSSSSNSNSNDGLMINEVEMVFNKYDANGDGKISVSELGAILKALGSETPPEELRRVMSEIDTDGDGFIDLKEFSVFYGGGDKDLHDAFDLYDRDRNGTISATELHAVLKTLGEKCTLKDCRRMIRSVDVDGDGAVNFQEFKKMMTRS